MVFKHKIVNDLAWIISSAPLMSFDPKLNHFKVLDQKWFEEEIKRCHKFLLEQDSNPDELHQFMHTEGRQLLGKRFEKFIEYWLNKSGKFEVLASNQPISKNKITLGEIDYIVKDISSGDLWHIEVAAKYYLGYNNSGLQANWKGINAKDTLEDKMIKFKKQLSIFEREEGIKFLEDSGISKPHPFLMMKGFFFYYWKDLKKAKSPKFSLPNHSSGLFIRQSDISEFFKADNTWVVLSKQNWFSEYIASDDEDLFSEIAIQPRVQWLLEEYNFGVMLGRLKYENGHFIEDLRVAVVLDVWPTME